MCLDPQQSIVYQLRIVLIGDLDALREALKRVEAYRRRRLDHFDRRQVNRQLRIMAETKGGQP